MYNVKEYQIISSLFGLSEAEFSDNELRHYAIQLDDIKTEFGQSATE